MSLVGGLARRLLERLQDRLLRHPLGHRPESLGKKDVEIARWPERLHQPAQLACELLDKFGREMFAKAGEERAQSPRGHAHLVDPFRVGPADRRLVSAKLSE